MEHRTIRYEVRNAVAIIALSRPEIGNAVNLKMARELLDAANRCSEDREVRAVLLTGTGRNFCFGGDIRSFLAAGGDMARHLKDVTASLHGAISRLARMEAPLVVAVNGAAAGAGFSLALIGDFVLAAAGAKFTMAYTNIGMAPDGSSTWYLPRLVGMRRAQELMFTNRTLEAEEAVRIGIASRVVPDAALMDEAGALARKLAAGPTLAYGRVKALLRTSFDESLETQMEHESQAISAMGRSADSREGIAAFLDKRAARFTAT
jgi:2-(1,2-epoxy-1,2-dihydrophenyl)acetyl-CoA isomerase